MKYTHAFLIMLVTAMLTLSVFGSGCTDTEPEIIETTATPTVDATEDSTPEMTAEPTATPEPTTNPNPMEILIRIQSYMFIPVGDREINRGDTVQWRNFESSKASRVLVSENGIWEEEQYLSYMRHVSYTFNETGEYTFYLKGREAKKMNVTVV
ncbi:MAG: hypothetical protein MIO93_01325 [ANME-2 cluster archaeon]|jgi:plastocyanin|nr:hypothetical protein [ANME-2 cluster archaeon]